MNFKRIIIIEVVEVIMLLGLTSIIISPYVIISSGKNDKVNSCSVSLRQSKP